jgi:2,3,4,5-tetrahydropyridine-2-carboxylate N-succinyltransferase
VAIGAARRREYPGGEFFVPCVLVIKRLDPGRRHDKAQLEAVLRDHQLST